MDWNALLSIILVGIFVVLVMSACGGMMAGGGCGMGRDPRRKPQGEEKEEVTLHTGDERHERDNAR